jgi:trans-aconitate methyltransferase
MNARMGNPWLEIPLADYEGHMASPEVDQARMLSDALAALLQAHRPRALAVIGCAGGNGFERIRSTRASVSRVVGVDVNPAYLDETGRRFGAAFDQLELICADVACDELGFAPVDLMFAALVFEYVARDDLGRALRSLVARLNRGGVLAVLLQLPAPEATAVTATPFTRVAALAPALHLLPPDEMLRTAREVGLALTDSRRIELPTGKCFQLLELTGVGAWATVT